MAIKLGFDLLSPCEITKKADSVGESKGKERGVVLLVLAIMAGIFIGLAAEFCILATYDTGLNASLTKLLGGFVFSLGLILVLIAGAELFTGNTLLIISFLSRKISLKQLLRNWGIVYIGNLIGSLILVGLIFCAQPWSAGKEQFAFHAINIAAGKVSMDFTTVFVRGILANMLVVLAVWLSFSGRTLIDKVVAVIFPITAFVASGFEHCIANMFFVPFGIVLKNSPELLAKYSALYPMVDLTNLNALGFVQHNLIASTLGNIVGGVCFVGALYWYVHIVCPRTNGKLPKRERTIKEVI